MEAGKVVVVMVVVVVVGTEEMGAEIRRPKQYFPAASTQTTSTSKISGRTLTDELAQKVASSYS